jgi:hypothetical protein
MRITVAGQDQPDVTITTAPGMIVEGRIEFDAAGGPPQAGRIQITPLETEFELPNPNPRAGALPPPVAAAADGRFHINGLFGPRVVRLSGLPAGWALKSVWLGDTDITDTPTDFRGSNAPRPMRVVVTDKTGTLSGTVIDARKRPARAYRVIVFPEEERLWGPASRFVVAVGPGVDGRFAVRGLLPGKYFAAAVDRIDEDDWHDADVLRRLRAGAVAVTVGAQDEQTVTLVARLP